MIKIISLGESNTGCKHFKLEWENNNGAVTIKILANDPAEIKVLREHLFLNPAGESPLLFDEHNQITIPEGTDLYFDGKPVAQWVGEAYQFNVLTLPEIRMIAEYNDAKTSSQTTFYDHLSRSKPKKNEYKRIDGHTHYVAAFPMKAAMEKALQFEKALSIPSLVVLKILKDKGIMNKDNAEQWMAFLQNNKRLPGGKQFLQKDFSGDLINEDFLTEIPQMSALEKDVCIQGKTAYYLSLEAVKAELGPDAWGEFCNGFDLPATHACDFTEHMETVYNLRNWFGKDSTFLAAQLEVIYEEYERQGIDYAEIPAGFFKKQDELDKFITISQTIEAKRQEDGKKPITLRPGLSIARLMEPTVFRKILFSYIPLILSNPALASITVLAHETNPTTEHLIAIRDFTAMINELRPGFTVEVHAGETAAYGEVNMTEARSLAHKNPLTVIRAGHATYGEHVSQPIDNFFEEKCPLSNLTLIDIEPEVQVNVLLGIAEGKTNMFWGSDGSIYNPLFSPDKQEDFYMQLMAHPLICDELERRWNDPYDRMARFDSTDFASFQSNLANELFKQLDRNQKNENTYIDFKGYEKEFYELKLNITKLQFLKVELADTDIEDTISDSLNTLLGLQNKIQNSIRQSSFTEFQNTLIQNAETVVAFNAQSKELIQEIFSEYPKMLSPKLDKYIDDIIVGSLTTHQMDQRIAVEFYQKFSRIIAKPDFQTCLSHSKFQIELNLLSVFIGDDLTKKMEHYIKQQWEQSEGMGEKPNYEELLALFPDENDTTKKQIMKVYQTAFDFNRLIFTTFDEMNRHITPPKPSLYQKNQAKFSKREIKNLMKTIEEIPIEDKLILDKIAASYTILGDERCEYYLDPAYYHNKVAKVVHQQNNKELQAAQAPSAPISEQALVLFGSPEQHNNPILQKEYMLNLYNALYASLIEHKAKGIILFGNVQEGINPLIYKIISDHAEELKDIKINHVVSVDENINSLKIKNPSQGNESIIVPYFIVNKPRQEAHIGYTNFVQQHQLSNIIMFGGKAAIWSDTKNAMAERRLKNDELLGHKIQFYTEGFGTTRSSSAYAKGAPAQCCHHHSKPLKEKAPNEDILLESKYYEKYPKTIAYHRNLSFAFQSLEALFKSENMDTKDFHLEHFLSAFNPSSLTEPSVIAEKTIQESKEQIETFFTNFFASEHATPAVLQQLTKMLGEEEGYGVLNEMDRHFPDFSLSEQIQRSQLLEIKEAASPN